MKSKTILRLCAFALLAGAACAAQAQTAVSLSVGSPGFYGAIDVGDAPPPTLVYQQPMAIGVVTVADPLYLYVPPDQYANWGTYCGYYDACNRRVFFVSPNWYQRVYVPHYRSHRHVYEGRRGLYERHYYRPDYRGEHRGAPRFDGGRGGPSARFEPRREFGRDEHRGSRPAFEPRRDGYRPQAHEEHRAAPQVEHRRDAPAVHDNKSEHRGRR
jgi:hypothetical protein